MERYRRSTTGGDGTAPPAPNEVRVTSRGKVRSYLAQALAHAATPQTHDAATVVVVISGSGNAVSKAVTVAEVFKRRAEKLHLLATSSTTTTKTSTSTQAVVRQDTHIFDVQARDMWDPVDGEDLDRIVVTRHLPAIRITMTLPPLTAASIANNASTTTPTTKDPRPHSSRPSKDTVGTHKDQRTSRDPRTVRDTKPRDVDRNPSQNTQPT